MYEGLGSAVGIATNYGLHDTRDGVWVRRVKKFLFSTSSRLSAAQPACYPMDSWGSYSGDREAGSKTEQGTTSSYLTVSVCLRWQ
jgi:hypothetical protein